MSLSWNEYWDALREAKGGTFPKNLKMSIEQLEKMQKQAYDKGFEKGSEIEKKDNISPLFGNMFGGGLK